MPGPHLPELWELERQWSRADSRGADIAPDVPSIAVLSLIKLALAAHNADRHALW